MRIQGQGHLPTSNFKKQPSSIQVDFIRVAGRYKVGKLLGSGASGEPTLIEFASIILSSLASVFQGKDIKTGANVALKIGRVGRLPSKLSHEYDVYTTMSGSAGISEVLWYGKEGLHEVIILEDLGTSLGDLVRAQQFDTRRTFLYASQMVRLFYH
jgi:hypothetical protein